MNNLAQSNKQLPEEPLRKLRVLLADDHDGFRRVLALFLRSLRGIEIVGEAMDGVDAVEKCDRLQPDLVLMDIHMPRRNGIEATKAIKSHWPQTIVIMMSVDSSETYQRNAQMVGDGYLPKTSMKKPLLSLLVSERTLQSMRRPVEVAVGPHEFGSRPANTYEYSKECFQE